MSFVQLAVEFNSSFKITSNATSESSCKGISEPGLPLSPSLPVKAVLHSYHAQSSAEKLLHCQVEDCTLCFTWWLCYFSGLCAVSVTIPGKGCPFPSGLHYPDKHSHSMKCKQRHIGHIYCLVLFAEYRSSFLCWPEHQSLEHSISV